MEHPLIHGARNRATCKRSAGNFLIGSATRQRKFQRHSGRSVEFQNQKRQKRTNWTGRTSLTEDFGYEIRGNIKFRHRDSKHVKVTYENERERERVSANVERKSRHAVPTRAKATAKQDASEANASEERNFRRQQQV